MADFGQDERGATSVTGLILLVAVTIIVASTVAVFVFGIDTNDVENAAEEILDMDDDVDALVPLIVTPLPGLGKRRDSNKKSADRSIRPRSE